MHLEEDAAKLVHAGASGRIHGAEGSVVDFNRGGHAAGGDRDRARPALGRRRPAEFGRLLQATMRRMGVSDVNMEEGSLRMDANVSIRPAGETTLGTKTELKNMNSFRFLERGILAEIERQERILADGGRVEQETLHFDPRRGSSARCARRRRPTTTATSPSPTWCRSRPTARDARARPRRRCPSCPQARAERFERDLGLPADIGPAAGLPRGARRLPRGDAGRGQLATPRQVANWVVNDLAARLGDRDPEETKHRARRAGPPGGDGGGRRGGGVRGQGRARRAGGGGRRPGRASWSRSASARAGGDELEQIVDRALAEQAEAVEKIRAGNDRAIGAVVGAVMRETKGRADGGEVQRMIREADRRLSGRAVHRVTVERRPSWRD